MNKQNYLPRIIDHRLQDHLSVFGAVCIEGPKWCGKTSTSEIHSKSQIMIGNPSGNFQNRRLAELSPDLVLEGEPPRLIDEWQEVPLIWDAVRNRVDRSGSKGQYILTGSATPNHKGIMHSGAGRIAKLKMRTMSLYESKDSTGDISLEELCGGSITPKMTGEVGLKRLIELIIRGGWPASVNTPTHLSGLLPVQYIEAILDDDIYRIDNVKRSKSKMRLLLRSLARNESTTASNKALKRDVQEIDDDDIDINKVGDYLDIFARLFLTDNTPPFSVGMRSSVRVKQSEKRHFSDPSLACALLQATPTSLLNDIETLGFLFESLCDRDLKIYAESFGGKVFHYQDYRNREIDAIVELPDGSWCAFEIKIGANQIDDAAKKLLSLQGSMQEDQKGKPPSVLGVICGLANAAYRRSDGVFVVPITALKN